MNIFARNIKKIVAIGAVLSLALVMFLALPNTTEAQTYNSYGGYGGGYGNNWGGHGGYHGGNNNCCTYPRYTPPCCAYYQPAYYSYSYYVPVYNYGYYPAYSYYPYAYSYGYYF